MTVTREQLIRDFGEVAVNGHASVFVGAGLSLDAGLPNWTELLRKPRREASIPGGVKDLPLVAEYYTRIIAGGDERLADHALDMTARRGLGLSPSKTHQHIAKLGIAEVWTTNFDDFIERAFVEVGTSHPVVLATDNDIVSTREKSGPRVIKMHGGIVQNTDGTHRTTPIILTRSDFERYTITHPRTWAFLRSTFLTRSMLFLGFSFDDPNLEVMLRLARSIDSPRTHYTVMRTPNSDVEKKLHKLRVADLERSGIFVCEVSEFSDIEPLVAELLRRTRPSHLFVSGGRLPDDATIKDEHLLFRSIGSRLAELDLRFNSLGGHAAGVLSHAFAQTLRQQGEQDAGERIRFFFDQQRATNKSYVGEVVGTHVYLRLPPNELRALAMDDCRAMLALGGNSQRSEVEVREARASGLPVIPVAATGGNALKYWAANNLDLAGIPVNKSIRPEAERHWQALASDDINAVGLAVQRLTSLANYLD